MRTAIQGKRIITSYGEFKNKVVVIDDGLIEGIYDEIPINCDEVTIFKDCYIVPGFIDIHIHGRAGADVMDSSFDAISTIAHGLLSTGVTGWVGTTVTAPWQKIIRSVQNMADYIKSSNNTKAELLGSFIEGPYFTLPHRGSHPAEYLISPTVSQLEDLLSVANSTLLRVAIAPEIDGAVEVIKWLTKKGILVSVAHTDATFEQVTLAYQCGAKCGVHLFNGMSALHHRNPGCVGAILNHDMLAEIIADGVHVHPVVLNLAYKLKGYRKLVLITDCMRAGGLPDGDYSLGVQKIKVKNGQAKTLDGSLAGSTCSLDQALRNMVFEVGIPIWEAIQMITTVPAYYLNLQKRIGDIAQGMDANLVVLDSSLCVKSTMIKGNWVFTKDDFNLRKQ